jgi:hypothetical protein
VFLVRARLLEPGAVSPYGLRFATVWKQEMEGRKRNFHAFIQVIWQVLAGHCALVGAEQPALQQRSDPVEHTGPFDLECG